MQIDDAIAELATKLDRWFDGNAATFASHDDMGQRKAIARGYTIVKGLDKLKADGLAAITSLLARQNAIPASERSALLIRNFEFAAKLRAVLHDELLDTDGANKIVLLMNKMANALDATGNGRAALAVLLDHPDDRVRATACAYLLIVNLMPERVVPILREIDERSEGRSADFTAHWALLDWELKQKALKEK
jgi:DnaJ-domain-containing protein 1